MHAEKYADPHTIVRIRDKRRSGQKVAGMSFSSVGPFVGVTDSKFPTGLPARWKGRCDGDVTHLCGN
jgi:hypothetical protein